MNRLAISAFILAFSAIQPAIVLGAAKAGKAATTNQNWSPPAYDGSTRRLPPGYTGVDPKRFHELFTSKVKALQKGEFETTEEFVKRKADLDHVLAPISTKSLYAFRGQEIEAKYDADRESYSFSGLVGDYKCSGSGVIGQYKTTLVCKVATVRLLNDKYAGSNAFGASRLVARTRATDLALAIPASTLSGQYFDGPDVVGAMRLVDRVQVPLEKAKAIKGAVGVLFVGYVTSAAVVDGTAVIVEPTIARPEDLIFRTEAIPFELKRIVYYVIPTGEILEQRFFGSSLSADAVQLREGQPGAD